MSLLLLCLVVTFFAALDVKPVIGKSYTYSDSSQVFYFLYERNLTWSQAVNLCKSDGGQLVAPRTDAEAHAILRYVQTTTEENTTSVWLGIHDSFAEGYFTTLDGVPISDIYAEWGEDEPNNDGGNENCVQWVLHPVPRYRDVSCETLSWLVCKVEHCLGCKAVETPVTAFFREDYSFERGFDAFYKLHGEAATWQEAVFSCAAEGAVLAAPPAKGEVRLLEDFRRGPHPGLQDVSPVIWLGIHDMNSEGRFVFLDGTSVAYTNWAPGEPNNTDGNKNCVALQAAGQYASSGCEQRRRFICKKERSAVTRTNTLCETHDTEYIYSLDGDSCYKLHTVPRNWHDAFRTCVAEGAHLGIISSKDEAKIYRSIVKKLSYDALPGVSSNTVLLGFNDLLVPGEFKTVKGQTLEEAGFAEWSSGQPDNFGGSQHCGSMAVSDGKLSDVSCRSKATFICEKNIRRPLSLDSPLKSGEGELTFCTA